MKVSRLWLEKFFDAPLPLTEDLANGIMFHAFEVEGVEKVGGDEILDLKVLQRGHDCLSHRGVAKEISAIFKIPLAHDPFKNASDISKKTDEVLVTIEDPKLCKRYIAGYIKGVKVGPSPKWLVERLEAIGQRSINNVVDATNFVMFNMGQPLHAFDADRLGSLKIGVRLAKEGEELEALDKKKYALKNSMLIITADDRPVGIAGVKGGMADRIDESTKDIIIESANFDAGLVRKTARSLNLRTDASQRFEQEISPELAARGMEGMMEFIAHHIGGEVVGFVDVYPEPEVQRYIAVTVEKMNEVLGITVTAADIADVFSRLGLPYKEEQGVFEVQPPLERLDLALPEDLIEEVGRIMGYDKIPATPLPPAKVQPQINKNFYAAEKAREDLVAKGYSEVFTSVFAEKGERVVLNKVDGVKPYLRESLLPGLTEALKKNIPNKDLLGLKEIKLFEIGTVWKGGEEKIMIGMVGEKEPATEMLLVGPENPNAYEELPISKATRVQPFSKYPYIVRDIAFWASVGPTRSNIGETEALIKAEAGELLQKISLFDTFQKGDKTSLAYRLIFQSFERTLTEIEVNEIMKNIAAKLTAQGFEIR